MTPMEQGVREEIDKRMPLIIEVIRTGIGRALKIKDIEKVAERLTEDAMDAFLFKSIGNAIEVCVNEHEQEIGNATTQAVRELFRQWMTERKIGESK